ncbi:ubiquinone/menaquinone biosynthesis C-methyltransferase UbiE [Candidatus Phycosocius bacilliformis]|uniref:Ubiquinone/menaquinone biosynthesis C-methyltransferase UbiE n=1 Tax=Candidatus Phycosocius bacilliformis TaxID=1445552 RepID=A0A2P2E8N3_9PROT|nr:class I SAM-dependent methyltransferase [Candidatus Phycosocius bacilliformis]GBF57415.1 ubiquinone/menaquinone biosynthesis C-methyltransferase UbiE [Candidatus Phycosocius bacilliformis]
MNALEAMAYRAGNAAKLAFYGAHYGLTRAISAPFDRPGEAPFASDKPKPDLTRLRLAFRAAFDQDFAHIRAGLYRPPAIGPQLAQVRKSRAYLADVRELDRRRLAGKGVEVREQGLGQGYPAYFRQNFHWQTDGWLSDASADLYDFQVETIFTGSAGAMRRATALALLARSLRGLDQRTVTCVEIACGTGQFGAEIMRNFPRLSLTCLDMSPAYAAKARHALAPYRNAKAISAAAEATPFGDTTIDRIVCIYLFHELPPRVRKAVVAEAARILKPGGMFILADALQTGDDPNLDRLLDAFPAGFHEPFFTSWLSTDMVAMMAEAGLHPTDQARAFLTKAWTFVKSG